ncbi:MAG: S26 family signal peptidase [Firmicutes bacterium]|nr:S26 family signal peptidase [Bacillota bacterium]
MIFSKLFALLVSIVFIYSIGFAFTFFLTVFLKYYLVLAYFPALYLTGLIDLIIIATISMIISLFIKTVTNARYFISFSIVLLMLLKKLSGHYTVLSNRVSMQYLYNLFDLNRTKFLPIATIIILICVFVGITRARNISKYYNLPYDSYDDVLPSDVKVMVTDVRTGLKKSIDNSERIARRGKILDVAFTTFLVLFIIAVLSFNVVILVINASTFGREFSVRGVIPYIFKSSSMEPAIMLNDLAYFKKLEDDDNINVGHIILFEEDNTNYVERVFDITRDTTGYTFHVDIDNYPPMSQPEAMVKAVSRDMVIGIYSSRNRWLGALILFANTIFGRLFFLLIPGILLFYYKPITEKLSRKT